MRRLLTAASVLLPLALAGGSARAAGEAPANDSGSDAVQRGAYIFNAAGCLGCHKIGENGNTLGPNLTDIGARLGKDAIARTLINPTPPMPSFRALQEENPEQFDKLVEYVASLKGE